MKCPKCHSENPETQRFCGECGEALSSSESDDLPDLSITKTLETPAERLTRGKIFANRYEIIEELGKGGMGSVYRAEDTKVEEEVALKMISPTVAADEQMIERFRNELRLARKIRHENVCQMYDLGESEGRYYITMEYVPGEDLKSFIKRSRQLSINTAITIGKQICEGLAEAHKQGVVHRDLKPGNIMIDQDGNARIMDFGIARSIKSEGITTPGMIFGTPEYMSPEQADAQEVDHRSDIYSLGVILYEMVTGQLPFSGDTPLSLVLKHKSENPKEPKEFNPDLPENLNRLILSCMEKDKDKRVQSIEQILSELTSVETAITAMRTEIPGDELRKRDGEKSKIDMKKIFVPVLIFLALAISALVIWRLIPSKEVMTAIGEKPSIAVLPFEDLSEHKDQEYFCDGMTEQIITNLTKIQDLKVIARTSVMLYKSSHKNITQISEELGVSYVLEGSVRKAGDTLRVTAQLIKAADGFHLWAEDYDRRLDDIFAIQDDVSQSIADALEVTLSERTSRTIRSSYPKNVLAYDYYMKARHFVETKYMQTKDERDFEQALDWANKAIELDPDFTLGYIGLAYLYENRLVVTDDPRDYAKQHEYIQKAYENDPNIPATNAAMGMMLTRLKEYDRAFSHLKKSREMNVNDWEVQAISGVFSIYIHHYDQAIECFDRTLDLNPLYFFALSNRGYIRMLLGDFDKALVDMEKSYQVQPAFVWGLSNYALGLVLKGYYKKAEEILDLAESIPPGFAAEILPMTRAIYYAALGERHKALAASRKGAVLAVLGMNEEAVDTIDEYTRSEKGEYVGFYSYLSLLNLPLYDSLRDEPRFQEILGREKSKYEKNLIEYSFPDFDKNSR
ncbi:MAG: protein kinase [Candidatus Aminicenantes bacterium]|jgi:serine/threonine protein kinase/tetratricopeptide (TPR) repeat protein